MLDRVVLSLRSGRILTTTLHLSWRIWRGRRWRRWQLIRESLRATVVNTDCGPNHGVFRIDFRSSCWGWGQLVFCRLSQTNAYLGDKLFAMWFIFSSPYLSELHDWCKWLCLWLPKLITAVEISSYLRKVEAGDFGWLWKVAVVGGICGWAHVNVLG